MDNKMYSTFIKNTIRAPSLSVFLTNHSTGVCEPLVVLYCFVFKPPFLLK